MDLLRSTVPECALVGGQLRALEVKKLLDTNDVPTMVLPHNFGHEGIVTMCAQKSSLITIAVLCKDFPHDLGAPLFAKLHNKLPNLKLHAFVEEARDEGAVSRSLRAAGVTEIFFGSSLVPFKIASVLKQTWFSTRPKGDDEDDEDDGTPRKRGRPRGSKILSPSSTAPVVPPTLPAPAPPPPKAVVQQPVVKVVAPAPTLPPAKVVVEAPAFVKVPVVQPSVSANATASQRNPFTLIFDGFQPNDPLPAVPVVVNIVGMHGRIVTLDPRRIRTMTEGTKWGNPRLPDNPGFTKASISNLAHQMGIGGQMEPILVCPLSGDPRYDAQLIDGERRDRAMIESARMVEALVREDVRADEEKKLYLMSIARNRQKEPSTTQEDVAMVLNLRGPDFNLTIEQVAAHMGLSVPSVTTLERLAKLHQKVLAMVGGPLTVQHAKNLHDVPLDKQYATAQHIVSKALTALQAQRYIAQQRRELSLGASPSRRNRDADQFATLATLVRNSYERFGIFWDMGDDLGKLVKGRSPAEQQQLRESLSTFGKMINDLRVRLESSG